ncbi:MAG: outer membrane protein assembly factor BamD [Candidatus Methylomirabilales bacterium]
MTSRQCYGRIVVLFVGTWLLLGGCASNRSLDTAVSEEALFWRANYDFMRGQYEEARERLRLYVTQFPDSPVVPEVRLGIARTYFEEENYEQAQVEYERFLSLHPRHERMDEALYFIGLSYFRQMGKADRDQTSTRRAVIAFRKLLTEVPDTPYAEDAEAKIEIARRRLAAQEINVGLFYLKRDKFKAARGRFQRVLDRYAGTRLEPRALFYLGEAYAGLKEKEKAQETYRQVVERYPNSLWAVEAADRLGIRVMVRSTSGESIDYPEESSGGIWGFFKESWEEIKTTFRDSLKSPPK